MNFIHKFLNFRLYSDVTVSDIFLSAFILFIAVILIKIITLNLRRFLKEKLEKQEINLLEKIITYTILGIAIISVLPMLGINISGILVAGGIVGIAVGFASQRVVSNLLSGIFLMIERPIRIGQQLDVEGIRGFVEDISIISTIVRTYDGLYVRIPNEKVFTSSITNFVAHVVRRFEYTIGIRYEDDAEKAIEIIRGLIEEHPFALKNPEPQVFVDNLGDNAVEIKVRIWAPTQVWYSVKMELLWKIKKSLEKEGIEIPFPQRVLWFANEIEVKEKKGKGK
jgi:small-conductance mechanosensitive channel